MTVLNPLNDETTRTVFYIRFSSDSAQREMLTYLGKRLDWTHLQSAPGLIEVTVPFSIADADEYYFGAEGVFTC